MIRICECQRLSQLSNATITLLEVQMLISMLSSDHVLVTVCSKYSQQMF